MQLQSVYTVTTLLFVFVAAIIGGLVAKRFRQPMLVGYIMAGLFFGNVLPFIARQEVLHMIADSGVTLLLFTLGVEFSFHRLRKILRTVIWAVTLQILLCILIFLVMYMVFGFTMLAAMFLAVAASLSSTAVVVKVLSDRGELETVPGEVMTGWLVIQDLSVVPLMIFLPAYTSLLGKSTIDGSTIAPIVSGMVVSVTVITVLFIVGRIAIPRFIQWLSSKGSRELFVLGVVGIVFTCAASTYAAGLSAALGAFIAGLLVSDTTQNHAIFAEIRPLRDLFAVVFFVSLGMALPVYSLLQLWPVLLISGMCIMAVKLVSVYGLVRYLGYHRKTAFIAAVGLTQMSEFGFIIAREGLRLNALDMSSYTLLVGLTFLTIVASAPLLGSGHGLYYLLRRKIGKLWPVLFHSTMELKEYQNQLAMEGHIVLCGYGRVGKYIGRALEMAEIPFVVVDYDASTVTALKGKGTPVVYGDPADVSVLDYAQVDLAKAVIIAIPDSHTQQMVIGHVQSLNRRIHIICRTHHEDDQNVLKALGVQTVIQPEFEAALTIVGKLYNDFGVSDQDKAGKMQRLKIEHGMG